MPLTDAQLGYFADNFLALSREDKRKYQKQIDNLKTTLTKAINEDDSGLGVTNIKQAGSWRKGTALKPRDGADLDIDLIIYLNVDEAGRTDMEKLHERLIKLLLKAYPNKKREDFPPSKKTVGIEFRTSGLDVDLVPVVPIERPEGHVWQPEQGGTGSFTTSPDGQLDFIRDMKNTDAKFASTVRLLKRWRNIAELEDFSSFTLELIAAHLVNGGGATLSLEEGLLRALLYIVQSRLKESISFNGAIGTCSDIHLVNIYDPTNNDNNVTSRMTEAVRAEIVGEAERAAEFINRASAKRHITQVLDNWRKVLGPNFRIED